VSTDTENCTTPDPVWGLVSGMVPPWLRRRCLCLLMVFVSGCVGCCLSLMAVELLRLFSSQTSLVGVGGGSPPMPAEEEAPACVRNSPDLRFSLSRELSPRIVTTWLWCSNRSRIAAATT
jgi:hypothetical protein